MSSITDRDGRRLSLTRVLIAAGLTVVLAAGAFFGLQSWASAQVQGSREPWFAGYVDVTATPNFAFETPRSDSAKVAVLSFIVADKADPCRPSWGGAYTLETASASLDLDRRIARLQQQGGGVAISFGGLLGDELSSACTDPTKLAAAYESVISRYKVTTIDLDVESSNLANTVAGQRRAAALKTVQDAHRASGNDLAIWLTLPTSTEGLSSDGTSAVAQLLGAGVDLAGVNAMTMDFGSSITAGETMATAAERALDATHRQLATLYKRAGITLTDATIWSKIGATPMLGQNDDAGQIFGLDDARQLNAYALARHVGRMSVWSLNRDAPCGSNYVDLNRVSDACSGVAQGNDRFADLLSAGFTGSAIRAASLVTTAESIDPASIADVPATSPYAIWSVDSSYLKGTKIVWHRNVYEAKWWTRGALPDDPVLNAWETPWTLIGPVLPGETPIPVPTVPSGTYPDWSGTAIYDKGSHVLFAGVPYEAKWWNQGESPEAYSSSPDSSPWVPLTQDEIAALQVKAG